jgi:hypothetical protein
MKRLLLGSLFAYSLFALPIDESLKIWNKAYLQGYEDGKKAGYLEAKELCMYLEGAKIFDDLLINGVIPPPKISVRWEQISNQTGLGYKRELIVKFQPVSMKELQNYKELADYIDKLASEQNGDLELGYYYIVITNSLPLPYKGLLEFLVKKHLGKEFVVGIERNGKFYLAKAEKLSDAKFLKEQLQKLVKEFRGRLKVDLQIEKL